MNSSYKYSSVQAYSTNLGLNQLKPKNLVPLYCGKNREATEDRDNVTTKTRGEVPCLIDAIFGHRESGETFTQFSKRKNVKT